MAAMRSALVMLGRRCCGSSGSSTAVSLVGGRGLAVHHVFRTSPSLLRPSARNLEGLHHFSTGCADQKKPLLMKHKAANVLQLWWKRSSDHLKNCRATSSGDSYVNNCRSLRVFGTVIALGWSCYMVMFNRSLHRRTVDRCAKISPFNTQVRPRRKSAYCSLPPNHPWRRLC